MFRPVSLALVCWLMSVPALASQVVTQQLPGASKVGEGRLTVAFWDVYDAALYAPNGQWSAEQPHALSIRYLLEIEGADIAERSVEEIKGQGFTDAAILADWQARMLAIFPNVAEGTELTAVYTKQKTTDFFHNGKPIGTIKDPLFGQYFFGIWLSEKTSEPKLRSALLGQP